MGRVAPIVLLVGLLLAGCARSTDPLEWKISGGTPEEINAWFDENVRLMPKGLAAELAVCVNNIVATTGDGPSNGPHLRPYRAWREINGRTVREVLIAGHELSNQALVARISNESEVVIRLLRSDTDDLAPEQRSKLKLQLDAHQTYRESLKQALEKDERRVAELRAPTPSNCAPVFRPKMEAGLSVPQ